MLKKKADEVFQRFVNSGWVPEPDAKELLREAGLVVPAFARASTFKEAVEAATRIGYPVAAKVVSPKILHKSDVGGVVVGIADEAELEKAYKRFSALEGFSAVLVEQMVSGVEVIVGAKIDYQFGPVVLLGIGGTGVEIYQDVAIRMAPLSPRDVGFMIGGLSGRRLLEGYRGAPAANLAELTRSVVAFSELVMEIADRIESIDLNPVMCTPDACIVADARIMLSR